MKYDFTFEPVHYNRYGCWFVKEESKQWMDFITTSFMPVYYPEKQWRIKIDVEDLFCVTDDPTVVSLEEFHFRRYGDLRKVANKMFDVIDSCPNTIYDLWYGDSIRNFVRQREIIFETIEKWGELLGISKEEKVRENVCIGSTTNNMWYLEQLSHVCLEVYTE